MSDNLAALELQLAKLRELRASGHLRVREGDNEVEFRRDSELVAAIADLDRRIDGLKGGRVHTIRFYSSKGI